jgi:hypothetical protein
VPARAARSASPRSAGAAPRGSRIDAVARNASGSTAERPPSRLRIIAVGALIGVVWAAIMWLIVGRDSGGRGFAYLAITLGMIGCGVAAIFGASAAKKRGERVSPKVKLPFRRR